MKPEYELVSFHIIEKFNNNNLITWTYPSIADRLKQHLLQNYLQDQEESTGNNNKVTFIYHHYENQWIYIWEHCIDLEFFKKCYALVLVTKAFNPAKYQAFGSHLCHLYESTNKPIELVKVFLNAFTNGSYKTQENGTPLRISLSDKKKSLNETFEELVSVFDVEVILIFNAILLKKRIFVYHSDVACLLKVIEVMARLIDSKVRNPNDYLYPYVRNVALELKGRSFFLAGMTERNINIKPESYDLFVNLRKSSIKISPNSKDVFQMTKWHKEVATLLTTAPTASGESTKQVDLYRKTADLLATLRGIAMATPSTDGVAMVTLDALRAKQLAPAMENFLFNLAVAESIMML